MNTAQTFTAQMANNGGRWRLYVALLNTSEAWPGYAFGRALPVPTFTERMNALTVLGFEPVPGAEWEWIESTQVPDDPVSPVILIASLRVRSRTVVGA